MILWILNPLCVCVCVFFFFFGETLCLCLDAKIHKKINEAIIQYSQKYKITDWKIKDV